MKKLLGLLLAVTLALCAHAKALSDNLISEAFIVTKAELRRHMAAPQDDVWRPATYADLEASRGEFQPDYLVLRFRMLVPGHYSGEAMVKGYGADSIVNVELHFNKGWVEYFIPYDGVMYGPPRETPMTAIPAHVVSWKSLKVK